MNKIIIIINILAVGWVYYALQPRVPVLCFHRITNVNRKPWDTSKEDFEKILRFLLQEGYQTIFPGEAVSGAKTVILSFDDGTSDHYTYVAPMLDKYGFKAIFFWVGSLLKEKGFDSLLKTNLKKHRVGSHAYYYLPFLKDGKSIYDKKKLEHDLNLCNQRLEQVFGYKPEGFAFPEGLYNQEYIQICRKYYKYLFSVDYDYFYPESPLKIHGRFMLDQGTTIEILKDYLDSANLVHNSSFWLFIFSVLFMNLLFFLNRKKTSCV